MNDYMEVRVDCDPCSEEITDVLAALLADVGFESFVADASGLTAYIRQADYNPQLLSDVTEELPFEVKVSCNATLIEGRDWNHEWERNYFKPIVVGDRCVVHSSFHTDVPQCEYDIVIDPKMAFGTGHHATTCSIITRILDMDMTGRSVIDMGTGTGILSLLAAMRGASPVTGIEIDEAAYENALENRELNGRLPIVFIHGDASSLASVPYKADIFLANINRNVITADFPAYSDAMQPGGTMLLSGFYTGDIPVIEEVALRYGHRVVGFTERDGWACVELVKDTKN